MRRDKVSTSLVREEKEQYGTNRVDQDGLWKKVIGNLFEEFLLFFTPQLHESIDFSVAPDFLDKELFQEVMGRQKGRRFADRLSKVRLINGETRWILIHIEIQSENERGFPERMFQYFYRIFDQYQEKIVAIAVHTSPHTSDMKERFEYDYFGTKLLYSYTNYKTEDYTNEELERSENIFAKIILASKVLHKTKDEVRQRYLFKRKLMREIIRNQAYSRTTVQATLHFVDYLLYLPDEYTRQLSIEIRPIIRKETKLMELYNKENSPPTVMNAFDIEFEKGIGQGIGKEKKNIAKKLLSNNIPLEIIIDVTELTLEEVKAIEKEIN